jgi:hypothetical protein
VIRCLLLLALAMPFAAGNLPAQDTPRAGQPLAGEARPRRQKLEAQLRQRMWRITQNRVGLTDAQMNQLAQTSRPFDQRRRQLAADEREARVTLRRELLAGQNPNQERVATSLDRVLDLQRRRAQLMNDEQRALAAFMTPVQRARYAALQEALRRRAATLRGQRAGPSAGPLDSVP